MHLEVKSAYSCPLLDQLKNQTGQKIKTGNYQSAVQCLHPAFFDVV